jgi:D-arginine dehydrogenase
MDRWDAVVIGGGIAGVSAAFELTQSGLRTTLLEMESQLAYHTTGRSAALYLENYGHPAVRPLSRASRPIFERPAWADQPLIGEQRGAITVATSRQMEALARQEQEAAAAGTSTRMLTGEEAAALVPALRPIEAALWEPGASDIDVAATHQMYVRGLRRNGGEIRTSSPVTGLAVDGDGWQLACDEDRLRTRFVVDAAGAWGDAVAGLAGVTPIGLTPMRRTAFMVTGPPGSSGWPLVIGAGHDFYFKPDGPQLLCSPSEEEPAEPGDPRPRETDIARAIERINEITTLDIRSVRSSWTGLRTFAPDRSMVIGEAPEAPGFFWLVGQGGTGIETAPAAAQLLASLVTRGEAPDHLAHVQLDALTPGRLRPPA